MPPAELKIVNGADEPNLLAIADAVTIPLWPEFMLHDAISNRYWSGLYERFPKYQFAFVESGSNRVMAVANSLPIFFDGPETTLPDGGWDWAFEKGVRDFDKSIEPNILCALQIAIPEVFRGRGLSRKVVDQMKANGRNLGLKAMIAPVRPSLKYLYPLTPMADYILWENSDGDALDPWLRTHARAGARMIGVCPQSMLIEGSIEEWRHWTRMEFPQSDNYVVAGALNPVEINLDRDLGTYIEPNVWMIHDL